MAAQPSILLNADRSERCVVHTDKLEWSPSPAGGVWRRMIEREGGEVARATTIVRFDPNKTFPQHTHSGGEEFLVLAGVWRDDFGTMPALSYVRNYLGSSHTPRIGAEGCTILVKLRQMSAQAQEPAHTVWDMSGANAAWAKGVGVGVVVEGEARVLALFESRFERTRVERWGAGAVVSSEVGEGGEELFVLEGSFSDEGGSYHAHTWARNPHPGTKFTRRSEDGCLVWFKTGHLGMPEVGV